MSLQKGGRMRDLGPGAERRSVHADTVYLYQVIEAIGSGPDLGTVLRGIVRLLTEATQCHACFVYFLEGDHLALRAASSIYTHLEGKINLPVGKGLAGWVVRTRQAAWIRDRASEDPRTLNFPELDTDFQSLVSVPMFARSGDIIGVVTLHAVAPHEFNRSDLEFLEHTASLVAGAVENARLYEQATEKLALLSELSELAKQVASAASLDDLLALVVERGRDLIAAKRCELYLFDSAARLVLHASSPKRTDVRALSAQRLWLQTVEAGQSEGVGAQALTAALWGGGVQGVPMVVPLVAGDERLGLLCALAERAAPEGHSALVAIAAHTAVAIRRHQLINSLRERNLIKDFFEALSRDDGRTEGLQELAARLRCDLHARHVIFHALPWATPVRQRVSGKFPISGPESSPEWASVVTRLEGRLRVEMPAAIFDRRDRSVRGILRVLPNSAMDVADLVRQVYAQVGGTERGPLAIGLSNVCQGSDSFRRGFEEAASAAEVGALLHGAAGVYTYEELGAYRYVIGTQGTVRDRYQGQMQHLFDYERRRGTELPATLEAYLEHQGSIVRTSRTLRMHPNTLRQRLARIERVAGLDLDKEDWLSLAMAIKAVKLQLMGASAGLDRRDEHGGSH